MTRQQALNHADQAPRCQHVHLRGRPCGSPALSGQRFCYYHQHTRRPKLPNYRLPLLEDATSVQFGLVQVARALEDKAYDAKTGALLLYALQTASANLRRVQEERDWERRELERQSQPKPTSHESFADIMIRGLGLRPPDPTEQAAQHLEDLESENSWPPQPFAHPLEDALDPGVNEDLSENRPGTVGAFSDSQTPNAKVKREPTFDEVFPLDPPKAPAPPARRAPASAETPRPAGVPRRRGSS